MSVYITYNKRKKLEELYNADFSIRDIADKLEVHLATVYRELKRGAVGCYAAKGSEKYSGKTARRVVYSAELAQERVTQSIKRRGKRKKIPVK